MVLDGAHPVDAAHRGLSVPHGGLLAGQVARVHTVAWTGDGPRFSAFTQPMAARPTVSFSAAANPLLVPHQMKSARAAPHPTPRASRSTHDSRARPPRPPGLTTAMPHRRGQDHGNVALPWLRGTAPCDR
jgi:hypothetical protein